MSLSLRLGTDLIGGAGDSTSSAWFASPIYDDFCAVADFTNWRFSLPASGAELSVPASQTIVFATGSASGAGFNITATTTSAQIRQNLPSTVVGKLYVCQFKWSGNSSGRNLFGYIGGNSVSLGTAASGTATVYITGGNTDGTVFALYVSNSVNGDTFYLEITSCKEVILTRASGGYGAENLVPANWITAVGGGTSTSTNTSGTITLTPDGTNFSNAKQDFATIVGQSYLLTLNVATNACSYWIGSTSGQTDIISPTSTGTGYITIAFKAKTTLTSISFQKTSSGVSTITVVSCRAYSATGSYPKQSATFAQFFAYTASSDHARTYVDQSGVYRDMAYNNENTVRNSTMVGAINGVTGSGGSFPTYWAPGVQPGITTTIIGTGTEFGLPYIDVRYNGTPGATGGQNAYFDGANANIIAATNGQVWTVSFGIRLVGGSLTNVSSIYGFINEQTSVGGFIRSDGGSSATVSSNFSNYSTTLTLVGGATTGSIAPAVAVGVTNGLAIDITIRIYAPQVERGSSATSFKPTSGTAFQGGINSPRCDYRNGVSQIRLEDARTNTMLDCSTFTTSSWTVAAGAITSSGVAAPDNTIASVFTENTATSAHAFFGASGNRPAVVSTDVYTASIFIKAGTRRYVVFSFANTIGSFGFGATVDTTNMTITEFGTGSGGGTAVASSIKSVGNGWYRLAITGTIGSNTNGLGEIAGSTTGTGNAGAGVFAPSYLGTSSTIIVWGMQIELGVTVSDPILTTTTAVTRAIETAEFSPVIEALVQNNPAVSFVVRTRLDGATLNNGIANQKIIGGTSNHFPLSRNSSSSDQTASYNNASAIVVGGGSNALTSAFGTSIGMDSSGRSITKDQFLIVSDTVAKSTYSLSTLYLNRDASSVSIGSASYDFLGISPERLSDVQLQQYAVAQGTQLSYPITTPAFATGADYWVDLTI